MMSYSPTTLLPPTPRYVDIDHIMTVLTDKCLIVVSDDSMSEIDREQHFHLTMTLVDFWLHELTGYSL
jgi:hypothetical protein